jgi:curli biogenesis system outer membrane secretion channel CsgG
MWAVGLSLILGASAVEAGQTKPAAKPAAARPAAAKPTGPVDQVIDLVKSGLSEDLVIRAIGKDSLHSDLSSADMVKLKRAGATDKVISAMMDGAAASAPAAAAAPAVEPAPLAAAPAAAAAPVAAAAPTRDQMRRAAIDEFDWATVRTAVQTVFGTNVDIGTGLRALLTTRVQSGGKIRIVERAKAETLIREQDFGASNRVKQGTNARIGQILGADVYLMGDIVAFGRDDRKTGVALGSLGFGGVLGGVRVGQKEDKAIVVVNYRLVDAETSEVIDTGEARGESKRKSKGLAGLFGTRGGVAGGGIDMTASNFAETIIGEATIDVADKLAVIMNEKAGNLQRREIDIEARVANVSGGSVTIAAGSAQGVAMGDRFEIFRIVKEIKDPVTGEVLDNEVARLGELVVTNVRERIATGTYSGSTVTVKDGLARKIMR